MHPNQDKAIQLQPRYIRLFTDPGEKMREENYGYHKLDWRLSLSQTALVCLDIWNPPINFAEDTTARTEEIVRQKIAPLLEVARRAGMPVIHAPGPPVAQRHANWVGRTEEDRKEELLEPSATATWPPPDFISGTGIYRQFARPSEPLGEKQDWERENRRDFHEAIRPINDEPVILNGEELHKVCANRRILHLFYVGFYLNGCIYMRNYGIWDMYRYYGYQPIIVRDCTTGMETSTTYKDSACARGMLATLEQFFFYTISSKELKLALQS